ncbi:hypothetical protein ACQ86N_09480 [Puia sp. P3]|uniref:hypothetical protein n=1 Tax=Puia sp. P3 TaxID=3423952 RepID=UPI003D67CCF2
MKSNYDKKPFIQMEGGRCWQGWEEVGKVIRMHEEKVIVPETYPGVQDEEVVSRLQEELPGRWYFTGDAFLPEEAVSKLVYPDVTDDEVFGYITRLSMKDFFDPVRLRAMQEEIARDAGASMSMGRAHRWLRGDGTYWYISTCPAGRRS